MIYDKRAVDIVITGAKPGITEYYVLFN